MNENKGKSVIGKLNATGNAQVNIVGEGVINQFNNSGSSNNVTREEFTVLVRHIEELIRSANFDKDTKEAIRSDLNATLLQSQKQDPQQGLILNRLKSALDLITSMGSAVVAGQKIYPLLHQAYDMASKLFIK